MRAIKICIAYDSQIFSQGIRELLRQEPDMEVVGSVCDSAQIPAGLPHAADVLILEPSLIGTESLSAAVRQIKTKSPRTRIIFFLEKEMSDEDLKQHLMHGVDGYVRRSDHLTNLVDAVRSVHAGDIWAERKLLNTFVGTYPRPLVDIQSKMESLNALLTCREKEIISLLMLGLPNKALSERLHISEKTVKTHLNNIFRKMNVKNRTQLVSSFMLS